MAKPKLALIPAAQGSKLYSVLPSSGVGDFDFTRSGSATRINSKGLIETVASGVSRLNYPMIDGVVKGCPHHILEPQRLQRVQYSEDFSQSYWTKNLSTITSNNAISPNGTLNASKLASSNDGVNSRIEFLPTVSDNTIYTSSLFVKKGDLDFISLNLRDKTGVTRVAYFDITNGTVSSTINSPNDAKIENYGNGWFRCSISVNSASGGTAVRAQYVLAIADGSVDTDLNTFLYIYGAMLEEGSYPTSYIPNYGTAAGVTRSAETANGSGDASTFNDSEGVLFWEGNYFEDKQGNGRRIGIFKNVPFSKNRLVLTVGDVLGQIRVYVQGQDAFKELTYVPKNILEHMKIAIYYDSINCKMLINGFEVDSDTVGDAFIGLDTLRFAGANGGNHFEGNTKQIQYFDTALNSEDLEKLTSWVSFQDMAEGQLYSIE